MLRVLAFGKVPMECRRGWPAGGRSPYVVPTADNAGMELELRFNATDRGDHVKRAFHWLEVSASGENTAAVAYAALELRLGIERLAIEYLHAVVGAEGLSKLDWKVVKSHDNVLNEIFRRAGNQLGVDRAFDFMRMFVEVGGMELKLVTPKVGQLKRFWQECSEALHVTGSISSVHSSEVRTVAFKVLTEIAGEMKTLVTSFGWPNLVHPAIVAIRDCYVAGRIDAAAAREELRATGLLGDLVAYADGDPRPRRGSAGKQP